jgi:hypothetical protein
MVRVHAVLVTGSTVAVADIFGFIIILHIR